MVTETDLVVSVVITSVSKYDFALAVSLKSRTSHYVEYAISTITIVCGVSSALHFQIINIFGIELRANVRSNAGVGDRYSINQPRDLVTSANVQLVMDHIGAWGVVGDHGQT